MPTIFHAAVRHRDTPPCARVTGSVDLMTRRLVALNTAPLFPMSSFFIGNWKLDGSANTCTKYHMPRRDTGTTSMHLSGRAYICKFFFCFLLATIKKLLLCTCTLAWPSSDDRPLVNRVVVPARVSQKYTRMSTAWALRRPEYKTESRHREK